MSATGRKAAYAARCLILNKLITSAIAAQASVAGFGVGGAGLKKNEFFVTIFWYRRSVMIIVIVGFSKPDKPVNPEAQLPKNILLWSSTDVPKDQAEFQDKHGVPITEVKMVFFDGALGNRAQSDLRRLFSSRFQPEAVKGISSLRLKLDRLGCDPVVLEAVMGYLTPHEPPVITSLRVMKMMGDRVPYGTGPRHFK